MLNKINKSLLKSTVAVLTFLILLHSGLTIQSNAVINNTENYKSCVSEDKSNKNEKQVLYNEEVYVGGIPFGVKLYTDGLLIIGFDDIDCSSGSAAPAKDAGMEVNDIIITVDGEKVVSAEDFIKIIEQSNGKALRIEYLRNEQKYECTITPSVSNSDGKYKTGMWLRDSTAGIGTVTFVIPDSGVFTGLGHGICDSETGALIPLLRGITSEVIINGVKKGVSGSPGELKGSFSGIKTGNLMGNTENGVFGIFTDGEICGKEKMPLGRKDDICEGEAYILCTLDDNKVSRFKVDISEIHMESTGNKNFIVSIIDDKLIKKTGGIVQGMSGSPIIQNGKLIGAITHVLVNDPTKGYGIFIDNMISEIPESII